MILRIPQCSGEWVESWEGREFYCEAHDDVGCCSDCLSSFDLCRGARNPDDGKRLGLINYYILCVYYFLKDILRKKDSNSEDFS